MSATTETLYTPEDLLAMPDGDHYELIDGRLVERNKGAWSVHVATRLMTLISQFDPSQRMGWLLHSGATYQAFVKGRIRKTSLSFICLGRLPNERVPSGQIKLAPDLAVEVISPNDIHYETDQRVDDYLKAGTRLVWVVNPEIRTVLIYRADGSIGGVRESSVLDGEDVIPGFRCAVTDLFATPKAP
jgi:Uma2 family endonuclease